MLKMKQFDISCIQLNSGFFFLYAFDDEDVSPAWRWVPYLFQWHEGSFYGSNIKPNTIEVTVGNNTMPIEGVTISSLDALELFGTEPFNQFVRWEFDDFSQTLLGVAPVMY